MFLAPLSYFLRFSIPNPKMEKVKTTSDIYHKIYFCKTDSYNTEAPLTYNYLPLKACFMLIKIDKWFSAWLILPPAEVPNGR